MRMTPGKLIGVACLAMVVVLMATASAFAIDGYGSGKCGPRIRHLSSDQEFLNLDANIKFIAEGRFGDRGGNAEKEVKLEDGTGATLQGEEENFSWPNCEYVPWELKYDKYARKLRFKVDGVVTEAYNVWFYDLTEIFIRTRASFAENSILVDGGNPYKPTIFLDGKPIYDKSEAIGPNAFDYLWLSGLDLDKGFCLTGKVKMCWPGNSPILRSNLAFQIKVGTIPRCASIKGSCFKDVNCNGKLDKADEPMECKFKLLRSDDKGGYCVIDEQVGKYFDFGYLYHDCVYYVKAEDCDGYTSSCAIAGRGGYALGPDLIKVYAKDCGCYPEQIFLKCPPNTRQCFVPVTFTVDGWAKFCCPDNGLIPDGMIYTKFPKAFECFRFFGENFANQLILGDDVRLRIVGKTSCLENLCKLFKRNCYGCGPLRLSLDCPWEFTYETGGGCLAVETIALLMNIAYNDMRLMPKTPGVDLECYELNSGPLEGKTVGQVLFIANEILGGRAPQQFGLIDCYQLVCIIRQINENYEFEDFFTSNDRGFLTPNVPFGLTRPAHCPEVRDYSKDCIVEPCVKIEKSACVLVARPGDTVTYKFVVKNCGPEDITVTSIIDTEFGDLLDEFLAANSGSAVIAPEKCVEFTLDAVIPDIEGQAVENTVTVTATADDDVVVEDSDTLCIGILRNNPDRVCFLPTTLTAEGWAFFCDPNNGIIPGGMIYTKFPIAFKCFKFFGKDKPNELLVGSKDIFIRYIGKTACLDRLCLLLAGDCDGCGKLRYPLECPWVLTNSEGGGCLAVETITLLLNVAYNDMRLMPRTKGVDLECYKLADGPLQGKTVAEVFNIANEILSGKPTCQFGLASCEQLVFILRQINGNYAFTDFDTFVDNGFLIPNKPYDPFDEPTCPKVPMNCKGNKW